MADHTITITYDSSSKQYSYSPPQTDILPADTITFNVQAANGCWVYFNPIDVFGNALKFPSATSYGPYAPSISHPLPINITLCVIKVGSTCTPPPPDTKSYSIKVG
jgi:hypothetical protein